MSGGRFRAAAVVVARTLALGLAVLAVAVAAPALAQKPRAERPTYEVGERWHRNDGVFDLVRIEDDQYVFVSSMGTNKEVRLTRDLAPARTQSGNSWVRIDPPITLKWPMQVGNWGMTHARWRWHGNPGGVPARIQWEIEAYEDVMVAGKAYKAFRLAMEVETSPQWRKTQKLWYAPEARQYVQAEGPGRMLPLESFMVFAVDPPPAPLALDVRQPAEGAALTEALLKVDVRARATKGLQSVGVSVNGVEAFSKPGAGAREVTAQPSVRLNDGRNTILVTAIDAAGERLQVARVVTLAKPIPATASAPAPPAPARPAPEPAPVKPPVVASPPVAAVPPAPAKTAPTVTLVSPVDKQKVESAALALAGVASAERGVERVLVTLNGVEVMRVDEKARPRAVPLNGALTLREGPNLLVVTVADADGTLHQEIRTIQYERAVPFTIALRYPEDRARVTEPDSLVAALVESSRGITQVQILVNGTQVHEQAERAPEKSLLVTTPVVLRDGPNAIVVRATEAGGATRQDLRTVVLDRPKVAAVPPPPAPAPAPPVRKQWAVVVGVGQYDNAAIPPLRYTVSDAEAIYNTLVGPAGFKKENVLLLTDRAERKPTLRNLKWALGTFLGRSAQKDDTVLIFFAGHGAPEVDTRGLERDGLAKYLIPSDADPDDLYSTALPMDELQTIFGRIEAERVVAFLDACYSGAAGGRTFAAKKTRAGSIDDLFLERVTRSKGRAIVTASRPAELSVELPELGHGIFTYYLVRGLKGSADLNRDGIISLQELYEYVEQQVSKKSRAVGGNQHPMLKGELEGALPLLKVRGQ